VSADLSACQQGFDRTKVDLRQIAKGVVAQHGDGLSADAKAELIELLVDSLLYFGDDARTVDEATWMAAAKDLNDRLGMHGHKLHISVTADMTTLETQVTTYYPGIPRCSVEEILDAVANDHELPTNWISQVPTSAGTQQQRKFNVVWIDPLISPVTTCSCAWLTVRKRPRSSRKEPASQK
jgi:hypothetical protein